MSRAQPDFGKHRIGPSLEPDAAEPLFRAARAELRLPRDGVEFDETLYHAALRRERLARWASALPELADARCDRRALAAAALFHDAAVAEEVRHGRLDRSHILLSPLDTALRERSVDRLQAACDGLLAAPSRQAAVRALRECSSRDAAAPEAVALGEAIELLDLGPAWLWLEARRAVVEGREPLEVLDAWRRQNDYGYWDARVRERLRFDATRRLARARLETLAGLVDALRTHFEAADLDPPLTP